MFIYKYQTQFNMSCFNTNIHITRIKITPTKGVYGQKGINTSKWPFQ